MKISKKVLQPKVKGVTTHQAKDLDPDKWFLTLCHGGKGQELQERIATGATIHTNEHSLRNMACVFRPDNIPKGFFPLKVHDQLFALKECPAPPMETAITRRPPPPEHHQEPQPECSSEFGGDMVLDTLKARRYYSIGIGTTNASGTECRVVTGAFLRNNWKSRHFVFFGVKEHPPEGWYRLRIYDTRVYWVRPWSEEFNAKKVWALVSRLRKRIKVTMPKDSKRKVIKINFKKRK